MVLAIAAYFGVLGEGSDRILLAPLLGERLDDGGWTRNHAESYDAVFVRLHDLRARGPARVRAGGARCPVCHRRGPSQRRGVPVRAPPVPQALDRERWWKERYLDISLPPYWFYDVLRALDHFREAGGAPDPRLAEAIEVVRSQQAAAGSGRAGTPHRGEVFFAVEAPKGEPSRWNTLRALRVLRWWDEGASPAGVDPSLD